VLYNYYFSFSYVGSGIAIRNIDNPCATCQLESRWLYLGHAFALEYQLALIKRTAGMHDASKYVVAS
jgi:hypothetical protein